MYGVLLQLMNFVNLLYFDDKLKVLNTVNLIFTSYEQRATDLQLLLRDACNVRLCLDSMLLFSFQNAENMRILFSVIQNRRLAPGSYKVDVGGFNKKTVDERASGPGWARAYEVERMAALPHLLHKDQWELKRLLVLITLAYLFIQHDLSTCKYALSSN